MSQNRSRSTELPSTTKVQNRDGTLTTLGAMQKELALVSPCLLDLTYIPKARRGGGPDRIPDTAPLLFGSPKGAKFSGAETTGGSSRSGSSMALSMAGTIVTPVIRRTVADDTLLFQARRSQQREAERHVPDRTTIWDRLSKETLQKDRHKHTDPNKVVGRTAAKPCTIDWETLEPPPRKATQKENQKTVLPVSAKVKKVQLAHIASHPHDLDVVLYTPHYGTQKPVKLPAPADGAPFPCHIRTASSVSDSVSDATDTTTTSAGAAMAFAGHRTSITRSSNAPSESDVQSESTELSMVDCGPQVGHVVTVDYKRALKTARSNREAHSLTTRELLRRGASGGFGEGDAEDHEDG